MIARSMVRQSGLLLLVVSAAGIATSVGAQAVPRQVIVERLPDEARLALQERDAILQLTSKLLPKPKAGEIGLKQVINKLRTWPSGETLRVAFLGVDTELHAQVEAACQQLAEASGVSLDFGWDAGAGTYRRWTRKDVMRRAEIRVSFDLPGYFSLVGTDCVSSWPIPGGVGGSPWQATLNLGGFAEKLPSEWEGVVRHEFLHALGFEHEHQNPLGPCNSDFRWEDDEGYSLTLQDGVAVADDHARLPGLVTYMTHAPNRWSKQQILDNLKPLPTAGYDLTKFDSQSVMLYRFEPMYYTRQELSECYPKGDGINLSVGDRKALVQLFGAPFIPEGQIASLRSQLDLLAETPGFTTFLGEEIERLLRAYQLP